MFLRSLEQSLLALPRSSKRLLALAVDISLCCITVWFAFFLRLDQFISFGGDDFFRPQLAMLVSVVIAIPIFVSFGFYRTVFHHSGWKTFLTLTRALSVYMLIYISIFTLIGVQGVPRTVGIMQPMLLLIAVIASRLFVRFGLGTHIIKTSRSHVLIYGAGQAGRQLAAALIDNQAIYIAGFLDDNK